MTEYTPYEAREALEHSLQTEQELGIEIIPGTKVMRDTEHIKFIRAKPQGAVLVPQPSNDRHDPLNWSKTRKALVMIISPFFVFGLASGPLSIATQFNSLIQAFNSDLEAVVQITGITVLIAGFSNFLWIPISTNFGRRAVLIWSTIICLISSIWHGKATTYKSFMWASVLAGIGIGPAEVIMGAVITDVFFLHERGFLFTLYILTDYGGVILGPVIAGVMSDHLNWQSFWWLSTGFLGVVLLVILVGFPETKFIDRHKYNVGLEAATISEQHQAKDGSQIEGLSTAVAISDQWLYRGYPGKHQYPTFWYPWLTKGHRVASLVRDFWIPLKLVSFPIVLFASLSMAWTGSNFLVLNITQLQVFTAPPYNFSTQSAGFTNFAIYVGAVAGLLTAGPFSDWISMRLTIRNNGIREPEMRLIALIPYTILLFVGALIVAIGYQHQWPWEVIVILGYSFIGCQFIAMAAIIGTYAIDCYEPISGEVLTSITIFRNLWAYGLSKFFTGWTLSAGFITPIMVNNAVTLAIVVFGGLIMYFFGKDLRRLTRNSSVHQMVSQ